MATPVPCYPNYTIDEFGNVFSTRKNRYLKHNISKTGYHSVELFNEKGSKRLLVHRLVAETFLPNINNFPQVNHIDENKDNNCLDNLEWCSAKYNMNYGNGAKNRHSSIDYSKPCYKENAIKNGKKVNVPVLQIDRFGKVINKFESIREATRHLGLKNSHICDCCKGKRKTANGYIWKYDRRDDLSQHPY